MLTIMLWKLRLNCVSESSNVLFQSGKICLRRKFPFLVRLSRSVAFQGKSICLPPQPKYTCMMTSWGEARYETILPQLRAAMEQFHCFMVIVNRSHDEVYSKA